MKKLFFLLSFCLLTGCSKPGMNDFIVVCNDHKEVTVNTCDAIENAINNEITNRKLKGTLDQKSESELDDLILRLEIMKRQSVVIDKYVAATMIDQKLLAEIINAKLIR